MSDHNGESRWKHLLIWLLQVLKVLGMIAAGLLLLAVIVFGLLFGYCALSSKF